MKKLERQYDLFNKNDLAFSVENTLQNINIDKNVIKEWQKKIINYQSSILKYNYKDINQPSLFESSSEKLKETFNPIDLPPQP